MKQKQSLKIPPCKIPGPDVSAGFYQIFNKKLIPILWKPFCKIETDGTQQSLFSEATDTLISKPHKDSTRKENIKLISLQILMQKILNKILTNRIQDHIQTIIHQDRVSFTPWMQRSFNIWKFINIIHSISNLKNHMIITLGAEKTFDKTQHLFMLKVLEWSGIQGPYLNVIKSIYKRIENKTKQQKQQPMSSYMERNMDQFY